MRPDLGRFPASAWRSTLRAAWVSTYALTDRERRAVLVVTGLLLLGTVVRYTRLLGTTFE